VKRVTFILMEKKGCIHGVTVDEEASWAMELDRVEAEMAAKARVVLEGKNIGPNTRTCFGKGSIDPEEEFLRNLDPSWLPPPGVNPAYLENYFGAYKRARAANAVRKANPIHVPTPSMNTITFPKKKNSDIEGPIAKSVPQREYYTTVYKEAKPARKNPYGEARFVKPPPERKRKPTIFKKSTHLVVSAAELRQYTEDVNAIDRIGAVLDRVNLRTEKIWADIRKDVAKVKERVKMDEARRRREAQEEMNRQREEKTRQFHAATGHESFLD